MKNSRRRMFLGNRKFIMKCILIGLICVQTCGCGVNVSKNSGEKSMIVEDMNQLIVEYLEDNTTSIMVTIKFDEKQKERAIITKEIEEETTSYNKCDELREFVKDRMIAETEKDTVSMNSNCDDEQILWNIIIRSEEESWNLDSLSWDGEEDYPEYWDELLELLGEK